MKNTFYISLLFIIHFCGVYSYGQTLKQDLEKDVKENGKLFQENLDKAYNQIDVLLAKARSQKNYSAELKLLDRKCRYFYNKNQIDDLIVIAEELNNKATANKDIYFQGMANIYLAESYSINGFHDRAILKLDNAYKILSSDKSGDRMFVLAKANVLNSFANVYNDKKEPRNAVKKLREVVKSYNELKNPEEITKFQYVNYSNLASVYADYNMDSAKYFAKKSIELKPKREKDDAIMMMNYYLLGKAAKDISNDSEAILYYDKSLKVSQLIGIDLNKKLVYTDLIELYNKKGKKDSAIIYENKLKQLEISMLESKYNSLQKVMVEDEKNQKSEKTKSEFWLYILATTLIIGSVATLYFIRKERNRPAQSTQESYANLIELANNNDPSFLLAFDQVFPSFSDKLLKINSELQKSEIEFCALLKLNLSTKEIAKTTFIETKTVQNKKYRIRKKLSIPPNADIYIWFGNLD